MFRFDSVEDGVVRFLMARRLLGKDLYRSACYLVDGLLIDSGIPLLDRKLAGALSNRHVLAIVNTHSHEDHIGANAILQKERRLYVYAHEGALPTLEDPRRLSLLPYQKLFFGVPSPSAGTPLGDTLRTARHEFKVIHAPGHSPDHVALYEERTGWLFSGDAFIGGSDRVFRDSYDMAAMMETLRLLARLETEVMFTGMGNVVRAPRRQIERKLVYFEELSARIAVFRRQGLDASGIARRLFPGDFPVRLVTSGDFSAANLVRSFLRRSGDN